MDNHKKAIIAALEKSCGVVSTACNAIGMARSTFYEWLKTDPEFKEAVDDIQEYAIDIAESSLLKNIKEGDTTSIIFYLKTKGKKRGYVEKTESDLNLKGGINLIFQDAEGCEPIKEEPDGAVDNKENAGI